MAFRCMRYFEGDSHIVSKGPHLMEVLLWHRDFRKVYMVYLQEVDPTLSSVKLIGTKVEINLRKADLNTWKSLEL